MKKENLILTTPTPTTTLDTPLAHDKCWMLQNVKDPPVSLGSHLFVHFNVRQSRTYNIQSHYKKKHLKHN